MIPSDRIAHKLSAYFCLCCVHANRTCKPTQKSELIVISPSQKVTFPLPMPYWVCSSSYLLLVHSKVAESIQWTRLLDWITGLTMYIWKLQTTTPHGVNTDYAAHLHMFENYLVGRVIMSWKVTLKRHDLAKCCSSTQQHWKNGRARAVTLSSLTAFPEGMLT